MTRPFDVEVKRTSELTAQERKRLCTLFSEVFHKPFPEDMFLRKYRDGYPRDSFHSIARMDDIAGAFSAVLFRYSFFGRECVFATAIDLMLESRFRPNISLMKRMSQALYTRLAEAGVSFVFSCVREEMMRFHQVVGGWREIGPLSYYIAPVRRAFLRTLVRVANAIPRASGTGEPQIEKVNDVAFRQYRYRFFPTEYRSLNLHGGNAMYTGKMFWELPGAPKRLRLSLLVDVWPVERTLFDEVVQELVRTDPEIDVMIYAGHLLFQPRLLFRVPRRGERPRYFLGGRILRPDLIDERVYHIGNWNINLSNTDLV